MNPHKKEYEKLKKEADPWQECMSCGYKTTKFNLEAHHPKGRSGINILHFGWICPAPMGCHRLVHEHPAESEARGLMERNRGYNAGDG